MIKKLLQPRVLNAGLLVFCATSLAFAYFYLEQYLKLDPCPLCMIDRLLIVCIGLISFAALIHNPKKIGQRIYQSLSLIISGLGIATCIRHIWLQNLPNDGFNAECTPGLDHMMKTLPFEAIWEKVFNTKSSCSDIKWEFLGFSIPEQTLAVFILMFLISFIIFIKAEVKK